jgi:hypothetical protein
LAAQQIKTAGAKSEQEFAIMKTGFHLESSKRRLKKPKAAKRKTRARFIGTRPLTFKMTLRGTVVDVKLIPVVSTTTHVNYEISISRGRKVLDWVPTRAELERIGRTAAMQTERQTSH